MLGIECDQCGEQFADTADFAIHRGAFGCLSPSRLGMTLKIAGGTVLWSLDGDPDALGPWRD